jgi:hypothetical protein
MNLSGGMNWDTFFTDDTAGTSLYWDPFATQWEDLGFTSPEHVQHEFGGMFPDYNADEALAIHSRIGINQNRNTANLNLLMEQESDRLAQNKQYRMDNVLLQNNLLDTQEEASGRINDLKKDKIISDAIKSTESNKHAFKRTGIKSGTNKALSKIALDSVASKINAANSSHAFSRKKRDHERERIIQNLGWFELGAGPGADMIFNEGELGKLEALKSASRYSLADTKAENNMALVKGRAKFDAQNAYEAWQLSVINNVAKAFTLAGARGCAEGEEWSLSKGCHIPTPITEETLEIYHPDPDPGNSWEDTGVDENPDNIDEIYDDIYEYENRDPGGYNDGFS